MAEYIKNMGKLPNYITNYILSVLMGFSIAYALHTSFFLKYFPETVFMYTCIGVLIFSLIFINKRAIIISGLVLGLSLILAGIILFFQGWFSFAPEAINDFIKWLIDYGEGNMVSNASYELFITILLCFAVSLISYMFTIKFFNFYVLVITGTVLFGVQWAFKYFVSYSSFYIFIFLILIYYYKHNFISKASKEANEYVNPALFTLFVLPVCGLIFAAAYFLPAGKPLDWKWLDNKVTSVINHFYNPNAGIAKFDFFSLAATGFGESDGPMGGSVKLDKTNVLTVKSPRSNVYLKAVSKDFYTGTSWKQTDNKKYGISSFSEEIEYENPMKFDSFESKTALKLLTSEDYFLNYFIKDTVNITFKNLKTKSIFAPLKLDKIIFDKRATASEMFYGVNDILSSSKNRSKNFSYDVEYYSVTKSNEDFQNILRSSWRGLYYDVLAQSINMTRDESQTKAIFLTTPHIVVQTIPSGLVDPNSTRRFTHHTLENVSAYTLNLSTYEIFDGNGKRYDSVSGVDKNTIYNTITQILPIYIAQNYIFEEYRGNLVNFYVIDGISLSELKALVKSSTNAYENYLQLPNNFPQRVTELALQITKDKTNDYDRVKAIETYLSQNYPYNLQVPKTPEGRDFVDYFLFDLKEGYCTYFATAMTVLTRSIGIPARYVEGYILPPAPRKDTSTYDVTNQQAHAWVEVHFDGFGWMPFEPTSPFMSNFYNGDRIEANISSTFAGNDSYMEYLKIMEKYKTNYKGPETEVPELVPDEVAAKVPVASKPYLLYALIIVFSLMVLAFIATLLFNYTRTKVELFRILRQSPKDSVLNLYKYYMKLLAIQGFPINPGETPLQYASRIANYITIKPINSKITTFESITKVFVLARYSTSEISDEDKKLTYQFYDRLQLKTKSNIGSFKYFVYRYLLGKI